MSQHQQQLTQLISLSFDYHVVESFKPDPPIFTIAREKLIVKLNTAPRMPPEMVKLTPKVTNKSHNVTAGNETSANKSTTTTKNLVCQWHFMHL